MTGERYYYQTHLKDYAQENRRHPTPEEKLLWYGFLRTHPRQFRRQKAFGCYIVDFYCSSAKLVIVSMVLSISRTKAKSGTKTAPLT